MASILKVDEMQGVTSEMTIAANYVTVTGEGTTRCGCSRGFVKLRK